MQERVGADHVGIALVKLAVPTLLGAISTPYRLYLVPLEGEGDLITVLHHIPSKGDRQVIPQSTVAGSGGKVSRIDGQQLLPIKVLEAVTRVEDAEDQPIPLIAILPE